MPDTRPENRAPFASVWETAPGAEYRSRDATFSDRASDFIHGLGIPREQANKLGSVAGFIPDAAYSSGRTIAGENGVGWAAAEAASYTPVGAAAHAIAPFAKAAFFGLPAAARAGIDGARLTLPGGQRVIEAASGLKPTSGSWTDFARQIDEAKPLDPSKPTHRGLRLEDLLEAATVTKAYPDALKLPVEVSALDGMPSPVHYRTATAGPPKMMVDPKRLAGMDGSAIRESLLSAIQGRMADLGGAAEGFAKPLGSPSRHAIYSQLGDMSDVLEAAAVARQQGKSVDEIVEMFGPSPTAASGKAYTPNQYRQQVEKAALRQQGLRHYLDGYGHNRLMVEASRMREAGQPATRKEVGIALDRGHLPPGTPKRDVPDEAFRSVMDIRDDLARRSQMAVYDWAAAREVDPGSARALQLPFESDDYTPLFWGVSLISFMT